MFPVPASVVLETLRDRLMRSCGPVPTIIFLSTDTRYEYAGENTKHINQASQAIHDVEEQFTSESDSKSSGTDDEPKQNVGWVKEETSNDCFGIGKQFDPEACDSDCAALPKPSRLCRSTHDTDHEELSKCHEKDIKCPINEKTIEHSPCGSSPVYETGHLESTSHDHSASKAIESIRTPSSDRPEKTQGSKSVGGRKRAIVTAIDCPKKRPKQQDREYPNLFWIHNPVRYAVYVGSCSRGQRLPDFFKNSLKKHWRAGHFHTEFGNPRDAEEAYCRVMDAKSSRGNEEGHYRAKRHALWGTPYDEPIPHCPEHGIHELYDVNARVVRYPDLPRRASDVDDTQSNILPGDQDTTSQEENLEHSSSAAPNDDDHGSYVQADLSAQLPHRVIATTSVRPEPELARSIDQHHELHNPRPEVVRMFSQLRELESNVIQVEAAQAQGNDLQQGSSNRLSAIEQSNQDQLEKDINHEDASDIMDQYDSASFTRGESSSYS